MKNKLMMVLGLVVIFTGCKKYEEGPAISLTPRAERIANTWVIEKATSEGNDVTENFDQYEIYFTSDGDSELSADYEVFGITYSTETQGTWEFQNDDENLAVDYADDDFDNTYQILKLTEEELWLREIGQDLELQLKEK